MTVVLFELDEALIRWRDEQPSVVQKMINRNPLNLLYRLSTTKQLVQIVAYFEDGRVCVYAIPNYNAGRLITSGCEVLGIWPADLIPATKNEAAAGRPS